MVEESFELSRSHRMLQLAYCFFLNLSDSLACDLKDSADLFERIGIAVPESVTQLDNLAFAIRKCIQENLSPGSFQANLDTFICNSGSPVVNIDTYEVEGLLFAGNPDFVADGDCDRSAQCPDAGCPDWERATRITEFSDLIPVFDVYLWTSPDNMQLICADSPKTWCWPGVLDCGTNYFWQVIAKSNCTQQMGPMWVFSTAPAGDHDHDCDVDLPDYAALAAAWMSHDCGVTNNFCNGGDIDKLGSVNVDDLAILLSHWMENINP